MSLLGFERIYFHHELVLGCGLIILALCLGALGVRTFLYYQKRLNSN